MNSKWPSPTECWSLLRDAGPPDWVLDHTACVTGLALAMADHAAANGQEVDGELIHAGAVLHDVGRSITQDPRHAFLGAELLHGRGIPKAVVAIVARHTGAGLTADDAAGLGLPPKDLIPGTLEERIVCHADNLYSGTKRLALKQLEFKYRAKGLDAAWDRIDHLHAELTDVLGTDPASMAAEPQSG